MEQKGTANVLLIIVVIILVAGVGFGAYYFGTKKGEEGAQSNTNQGVSNTNTVTNTTVPSGFSASGEKINDPVSQDNFVSIKVGSVLKDSEPGATFVEDANINSATELFQFQITTSDAFPDDGVVTVKGYNLETEAFEGESITLNVRTGTNTLCCYPTPPAGDYEVLFYYQGSLVKIVQTSVQ